MRPNRAWSAHIAPLFQVIGSERTSDEGAEASGHRLDPPLNLYDSGYQRVMVSPGIEVDMHRFSFYSDVEVPVFLDFRGNQLVARWLLKSYVSYHF